MVPLVTDEMRTDDGSVGCSRKIHICTIDRSLASKIPGWVTALLSHVAMMPNGSSRLTPSNDHAVPLDDTSHDSSNSNAEPSVSVTSARTLPLPPSPQAA